MSHRENLTRIRVVNNSLGELRENVVFVGGATVSLYADRYIRSVRPTDDIDIVIEILSYKNYSTLDEQLRKIGFQNDIASGVICRYRIKGIIVDVMPLDEKVLGFSNKWYKEAYSNAIGYMITENEEVKIFTAPYFLATKIEAFKGRGNNDGRTSPDFEDIVFLLENRQAIWDELQIHPEN